MKDLAGNITTGGSWLAEKKGAIAGLRFAEQLNAKISAGVSILYDPWQAALVQSKKGTRKFDRLADKIAHEHCFMATFRDNFVLGDSQSNFPIAK